MRKKYKFWLILVGIAVIATLFLLLAEPKLPRIEDFFHKGIFGIISLVLYLVVILTLLIKYFAAKVLGINLLTMKKIKKREPEKKKEQKAKADESPE